MPLFKKKQKKVTTYSEGKEVPEKIPELEVPRPVVRETPTPEPEAPQETEIEIADYFDTVREQGFIEGLSFAISTLRQAQNDIIRRQKER